MSGTSAAPSNAVEDTGCVGEGTLRDMLDTVDISGTARERDTDSLVQLQVLSYTSCGRTCKHRARDH